MDLDNRLLIFGAVCVSCILYQVSLNILLPVLIVAAAAIVYLALSAQKKRLGGTDLGLKQHQHARLARRRNFYTPHKQSPAFDNSLYHTPKMTSTSPWGVTKVNSPINTHHGVRVSPLISSLFSQESPVKNCSSRGFATQVVSTAFQNKSLSHQTHYSGVGVFPTIHLQKASLPFLSQKNSSMVQRAVTIKIAPPEKSETPSPRVDFVFNSEVNRSNTSVESVVTALKSRRKRSIHNVADNVDATSKRQRRDSSSSTGSAFRSLSPTPSNVLNGMLRSSSNLLLQQETPKAKADRSEPQKRGHLYAGSSNGFKKSKNNAIFSSYSSSNRIRVKQAVKRQRLKRPDSPSIKISKLHHSPTCSDLLIANTVTTTTTTGIMIQPSPTTKTTTPGKLSENKPDLEIAKNTTQEDKLLDKSPASASALREGFSWKRQMSLYTSIYPTKSKTFYIPQCDDTVEGDQKDQEKNQIKLQKLLGCVAQTFREIDVSQNKLSMTTASNFTDITASTTTSSTTVTTKEDRLLTIAPLESLNSFTKNADLGKEKSFPPSSVSGLPFVGWTVPTVDTTTTTSTLTTVSSTKVGGQEVEKIHEQSSVQFSSPSVSPQVVGTLQSVVNSAPSTNTLAFNTTKTNESSPFQTATTTSSNLPIFALVSSASSSLPAVTFNFPSVSTVNTTPNLATSTFSSIFSCCVTTPTSSTITPVSSQSPLFVFGSVATTSSPLSVTSTSFSTSGPIFQLGQNSDVKSSITSSSATTNTPQIQFGTSNAIPPANFSNLTPTFQLPTSSSNLFKLDNPVTTSNLNFATAAASTTAPTSSLFQFGTGNASFNNFPSFNPAGVNFQVNSTPNLSGNPFGGGSNPTVSKENSTLSSPFNTLAPASTAGGGFTFGQSSTVPMFGQPSTGTTFGANRMLYPTPSFNDSGAFQFGASTAPAATTFNFGAPVPAPAPAGGMNFNFTPEPSTGTSSRRSIQARRRNHRQH